MRLVGLASIVLLVGCSIDLSHVCPNKPITQGVFGEIVDSNNTLEENVEVDIYEMINGVQNATPTFTRQTTRGGYQIDLNPSTYILCAKTVCAPVTVPTGLVEFSAVDAAAGLKWDAPVAVPPAQTIGPCTWGN
jgi:bifunctional DNase/RNase